MKMFLILSLCPLICEAKGSSPLQETFSVTVVASGDISGSFDFGGAIGATLEAESNEAPPAGAPVCKGEFLFRKVLTAAAQLMATPEVSKSNQIAIEVWPTFKCTIQGQNKTFKMHRQMLKLSDEVQKKEFHNMDPNLKNLSLEFRDLAVKKGK